MLLGSHRSQISKFRFLSWDSSKVQKQCPELALWIMSLRWNRFATISHYKTCVDKLDHSKNNSILWHIWGAANCEFQGSHSNFCFLSWILMWRRAFILSALLSEPRHGHYTLSSLTIVSSGDVFSDKSVFSANLGSIDIVQGVTIWLALAGIPRGALILAVTRGIYYAEYARVFVIMEVKKLTMHVAKAQIRPAIAAKK